MDETEKALGEKLLAEQGMLEQNFQALQQRRNGLVQALQQVNTQIAQTQGAYQMTQRLLAQQNGTEAEVKPTG